MSCIPDEPGVAATVRLLGSERPTLTYDEARRVEQRLSRVMAPRGRGQDVRRRWSRPATIACLVPGVVFMTAGTSLAISGLSTPGTAVQAQYPDSGSGHVTPSSPGRTEARASVRHHGATRSLNQVSPTSTRGTLRYVTLVHAETRGDLPFTGYDAIPILVVGLGLITTGTLVGRRREPERN